MHIGHVIALEIILDIGFPVAADLMRGAAHEAIGLDRPVAQSFVEHGHRSGKRRGIAIHIDEDEAAPGLATDRIERIVAWIESLGRTEIPRIGKPAVERVAPTVIAAHKRARAFALAILGQRAGAMPAHIVEAA